MASRKLTCFEIEEMIVKLRKEGMSFKIGQQVMMGESAVRKVFVRSKKPGPVKKPGRPRKTSER